MDIKCTNEDNCLRLPNTYRTIAIGDLHGDLNLAINVLLLAEVIKKVQMPYNDETVKVIDKNNEEEYYAWIGNTTQVVQVGDQIDRCRSNITSNKLIPTEDCISPMIDDEDSDIKILTLYTELDILAKKYGGRLINLLGNHELMNLSKDFRYVSPMGVFRYNNLISLSEINTPAAIINLYKTDKKLYDEAYKSGITNRSKEFSNTQLFYLSQNRRSAVIIKDILFVHGGIVDTNFTPEQFENINYHIQQSLLHNKTLEDNFRDIFWNRKLNELDYDDKKCKKYKKVFEYYNIKRIVVGHTPQINLSQIDRNGINSSCNETIWRIDIASSLAFKGIPNANESIQVLEILHHENGKDKFNILKADYDGINFL